MRPEYTAAAEQLGALIAREKIDLICGGGCVGLMGAVADAALKHGGHVIGVIPEKLVLKEVVHEKLPDLRVVKTMHERKALMSELADGFIALPGV
ncbi:MAG TPA: LOG family protein [Candidatus Saccharimonadales bacterium]|nr:LOG family protein [Candidatus Saccharimonadales bacterium]